MTEILIGSIVIQDLKKQLLLVASPMNKDLDKALKEKFLCQTKFTNDIENLVKNSDDLNYIDAIVFYCEENKIELESVSKLISKPLKEKIKAEAIELNFLKRTSRAKLPL